MKKIDKKSNAKGTKKSPQLTEERIREIAREEIMNYMGEKAKIFLPLMLED